MIVKTSSDVPLAAGMGSSASAFVSAALAAFRALGVTPTKEQLVDAAMAGERMVHGRPSGVDVEIAVSGGALRYVKGGETRQMRIRSEPPLVVVNTGIERRTGDMVELFRANLEAGGDEMRVLLDSMGAITDQIGAGMERSDLELVGRLMVANHVLLSRFGVSLPILDRIVVESVGAGALGAKLTGAGGGGSAIALVRPGSAQSLIARMRQMGLGSFLARYSPEGARAWSS
jgi:mevalonate kinase